MEWDSRSTVAGRVIQLALPFFIKTKGFPDLQERLFDVSNPHDVKT